MQALGFFEVAGVTPAVTALDIMCKTANVEFVTWERKLGGRLVTIIVQGDVSDVTQALETAAEQGIKKPVNYVVIARPHEEIIKLVELSASRMQKLQQAKEQTNQAEEQTKTEEAANAEESVKASETDVLNTEDTEKAEEKSAPRRGRKTQK